MQENICFKPKGTVCVILSDPPFKNKPVFRIRIRSDPYHLVGSGSGSVSGNVDMDPGSAKN